ncbi:MAG: hypothetical protein EA398_10860 [Deltaproteobacteria bacterium]|nr:MAG: hypothetical protein EA398_10860 [Deltaproteobacteria bacterium]
MSRHAPQRISLAIATAIAAVLLAGCRLDAATDPHTPDPTDVHDAHPDASDPGTTRDDVADPTTTPSPGTIPSSGPNNSSGPDNTAPEDDRSCLAVLVGDYTQTASLSRVDAHSLTVERNLTSLFADTVIRRVGDRLFALERLGADTLVELDPERSFAVHSQRSLGSRSNPWDIIAQDDAHGWISLYGEDRIAQVHLDPGGPARSGTSVDVSPWAPAGGDALPAFLLPADGAVHVVLQRLRRFSCGDDTAGAVLRWPAEAFAQPADAGTVDLPAPTEITLSFCNPVTAIPVADGLLVGSAGNYRVRGQREDDGGIEWLGHDGTRAVLATEADLGDRDVVLLRPASAPGQAWVLAADESFSTAVFSLDLRHGVVDNEPIHASEGVQDLIDLDGVLWIADRNPARPGLVRVDAATGARLDGGRPLAVGGMPQTLVALPRERCGWRSTP